MLDVSSLVTVAMKKRHCAKLTLTNFALSGYDIGRPPTFNKKIAFYKKFIATMKTVL